MIKNLELYLKRKIKFYDMQRDLALSKNNNTRIKELSIVINTLESCLNDHLDNFVFSADEFVVKE